MLNAGSETWNASERAQRQHLIKILQEIIDDLSADSQESEAPAASLVKFSRSSKTLRAILECAHVLAIRDADG